MLTIMFNPKKTFKNYEFTTISAITVPNFFWGGEGLENRNPPLKNVKGGFVAC